MKTLLLTPNDLPKFIELISVFGIVFEMQPFQHPSNSHLQKLLEKDNFYAIVALDEDKVVGGLTVYVLDQYYATKPLAYLYDLAVLGEYQRRGIGSQLIAFTNQLCRQRGFQELFVQADKVDDYAIDFYRSTQPTAEEQVVHFYYQLDQ